MHWSCKKDCSVPWGGACELKRGAECWSSDTLPNRCIGGASRKWDGGTHGIRKGRSRKYHRRTTQQVMTVGWKDQRKTAMQGQGHLQVLSRSHQGKYEREGCEFQLALWLHSDGGTQPVAAIWNIQREAATTVQSRLQELSRAHQFLAMIRVVCERLPGAVAKIRHRGITESGKQSRCGVRGTASISARAVSNSTKSTAKS